MNVAFVSNVVYPFVTGGAEKRIYEISTRLAARGHEVTIYGRHFWDGPKKTVHEGVTLRAVSPARDLYVGDRRSITEAIEFSKDLLFVLRRALDEHDLVVASVFPYFPVLTAKAGAIRTATPLITTWHEVWGSYWNEYLGLLGPCGRLIERLTAKTPQHPIAVSGVTADRLAAIGPARDRIDIVPNGIDVDRIQSVQKAENGFDVLFAGRLIAEKNVEILIEAFDSIASSDCSLGIIGEGPRRDALERQADDLSCSDQISFLGFLEREEMLGYMNAARVFVSPSTREGFGITVAEAMAAGCVVIAADHPHSAASEVVGDGGFLVSPTAEALANRLEQVLDGDRPPSDPTTLAERYDWKRITDRAEQVYQRVLDSSSHA